MIHRRFAAAVHSRAGLGGVPDGCGIHFVAAVRIFFSNLRRPAAHNCARWNFVRHQGQPQLKFFPALTTFGVLSGPDRIQKLVKDSVDLQMVPVDGFWLFFVTCFAYFLVSILV